MKKEFVRNPYNYDSDSLSDETGLSCPEPTLTQQQFLEETDINFIADRFLKTGQVPQVPRLPTSGDFYGIEDFQGAMNLITQAKQEFANLPAKIRKEFDNDPAKLLDFLDHIDEGDNRAEAIRLGLIKKPKENTDAPGPAKSPARETETGTRAAGAPPNANNPAPAEGTRPKNA